MRGGCGQVGTLGEQPGQPVVRPASQLVGERSVSLLGHPTNSRLRHVTQVELHHGAATDVGLLRENNEDAYLVAPPVFVVADGMGGHENGDVASAIVVEEFARLADEGYDADRRHRGRHRDAPGQPAPDRGVRRGPRARGRAVRRAPRWSPPCWSRTTALPPGCSPTSATRGSTRVSGGELRQVSVDHSVVQELVDSGEITGQRGGRAPGAARDHPRAGRAAAGAGRLLRAAGHRGGAAAAVHRRGQRARRRRPDRARS